MERHPRKPASWAIACLEDICVIKDGMRVPVNQDDRMARIEGKSPSELYPYYGATGAVGWIDDYIFEGEHVLVGEDGAPFFDPIPTPPGEKAALRPQSNNEDVRSLHRCPLDLDVNHRPPSRPESGDFRARVSHKERIL